jgi:sodium/proline symporter
MSVAAGAVGRVMSSRSIIEITDSATVFIQMTRSIFPPVISGILLSAILAASMSTADSQLLASASAFASDVYKPVFRRDASDREMLWAGRVVVVIIAVIALIVASNPNSGTIMGLVENAWGVFGAAFGPTILLSLFWRRLNFGGAVAGIVCGALADILWLAFLKGTGLYEIIPGFVIGLVAAIVVSLLTPAPDANVQALFDRATSPAGD